MASWYILDESVSPPQPQGPYGDDQLREMVASGRVTSSTRIAQAGGAAWTEAGLEPAFAGLFRSVPPQWPVSAPMDASMPVFASDFTFSAGISATFEAFKRHWTSFLVIALVNIGVWLVISIPQFVGGMIDAAGQRQEPSVANFIGLCLTFILNILVGMPFLYGCVYAATQAMRGPMNLGDTLIGFRNYGQTLLGVLLVGAVYMGCAVVAYIPAIAIIGVGVAVAGGGGMGSMVLLMGLGFTLTIVVLVVLFALFVMRVVFVPLVAIDPAMGSMGIGRALNYSWNATKGRGWSMLGLFIVVGLLAGLSIFLLCVGYLLVGLPLMMAMLAVMHEMLNRRGIAAPAPVVA